MPGAGDRGRLPQAPVHTIPFKYTPICPLLQRAAAQPTFFQRCLGTILPVARPRPGATRRGGQPRRTNVFPTLLVYNSTHRPSAPEAHPPRVQGSITRKEPLYEQPPESGGWISRLFILS